MQPRSFTKWLQKADPGSQIMYHIGLLMKDRLSLKPLAPGVWDYVVNDTHFDALEVWMAYLKGQVELTQRKRPDGDYEYWATKRRHRAKDRITDNGGDYRGSQFGYIFGPKSAHRTSHGRRNSAPYHNREGEPSAL